MSFEYTKKRPLYLANNITIYIYKKEFEFLLQKK